MSKNLVRTTHSFGAPVVYSLGKLAAAAVTYAGFAVYLYQPYFKDFNKLQHLLVVNACLASLGCFVLSRRWLATFAGSFFAGAIYGFGPFLLGLARFHPTAGFWQRLYHGCSARLRLAGHHFAGSHFAKRWQNGNPVLKPIGGG